MGLRDPRGYFRGVLIYNDLAGLVAEACKLPHTGDTEGAGELKLYTGRLNLKKNIATMQIS